MSIGRAPGIEPATSRSAVKRSTDWANPGAVNYLMEGHRFNSWRRGLRFFSLSRARDILINHFSGLDYFVVWNLINLEKTYTLSKCQCLLHELRALCLLHRDGTPFLPGHSGLAKIYFYATHVVLFSKLRLHTCTALYFRFITILYYLNDVQEGGETAFLIADNTTITPQVQTN